MAKRTKNASKDGSRKKYKVVQSTIDPNTSGIYATCARNKERLAAQELSALLEEKVDEFYGEEIQKLKKEEPTNEGVSEVKEDCDGQRTLSVEEEVEKELLQIKSKSSDNAKKNRPFLQPIQLQTECLIFIKTRKPIIPEEFVAKIVHELADPKDMSKRTRYVQRLTPVTDSCHASMEELDKLCQRVLERHFHADGIEPLKFAIEINKRNFNTLDKMDMIRHVAGFIGKNGSLKHTVDLKNYDKLVIMQCFKNNIGMCVVDEEYQTQYRKYNIQEIYEQKLKNQE